MLKKIDWAKQFLETHLMSLSCPHCQSVFKQVEGYSIVCRQGHRFDVSKKGSLHMMKQKPNEDYSEELFNHRYQLAQAGFFTPLLDSLEKELVDLPGKMSVDIGCGEGSHLAWLQSKGKLTSAVGIDIAKAAIQEATNHFSRQALWMLADLANLPFADASCANLLNILTPSNYQEFHRVLTVGGKLIKVIPGEDYLIELRKQLYRSNPEKQQYHNETIIDRFQAEFPNMKLQEVSYQVSLTPQMYEHLLYMTPLYWGANEEDRMYSHNHVLSFITVHLMILIATKDK